MPSILRVFLLLAVVICISEAQAPGSGPGSSCLCRHVRRGLMTGAGISNIQVHQPSVFCDRYEIVITPKEYHPYCLNPTSKAGKKVLDVFMAKKKKSSANSTSPL